MGVVAVFAAAVEDDFFAVAQGLFHGGFFAIEGLIEWLWVEQDCPIDMSEFVVEGKADVVEEGFVFRPQGEETGDIDFLDWSRFGLPVRWLVGSRGLNLWGRVRRQGIWTWCRDAATESCEQDRC